ncbi:MAG: nucleotide pyrophosphohydrolase [Elusimicrobiales bacterium]|nr:nucleotide pyrophosphohydrolase [Elusimicrobiales bacterium]
MKKNSKKKFDDIYKRAGKYFVKLLKVMHKLYSKNGCPWDRTQTHKSLLKFLYEEVDEFNFAVKARNYENMKEEIGDILLQVVFHCEIALTKGKFDILEVIKSLIDKLIRRHPHVFGNEKCYTKKDVMKIWKKIKEKEKEEK